MKPEKKAKFTSPSSHGENKNYLGLKHAVYHLAPMFERLTGESLEAQERVNYDRTPRGDFFRFIRAFVKTDFPQWDDDRIHDRIRVWLNDKIWLENQA